MNKIYKVVWNKARNCYVVGSEFISSHSHGSICTTGKKALTAALAAMVLTGFGLGSVLQAADLEITGPTRGNGEVGETVNTWVVTEDSNKKTTITDTNTTYKFESQFFELDENGNPKEDENGNLIHLTYNGTNIVRLKMISTENGKSNIQVVDLEDEDYVTGGKIDGSDIILTRKSGKEVTIDGLTDYRLIQNKDENGNNIAYTVDKTGKVELTVEDEASGKTDTVTIDGIAVVYQTTNDKSVSGGVSAITENLISTNSNGVINETGKGTYSSWLGNPLTAASTSITLGKNTQVAIQGTGYAKTDAILFGNDTYTGGIAIGENSGKVLNNSITLGINTYKGNMGNVDINAEDSTESDYNVYDSIGPGTVTIGSNSFSSGTLATNIGTYNILTTDYLNPSSGLIATQNFGASIFGTLNSIESYSTNNYYAGIANSIVGTANRTANSNGSLIFGAGNEITNSIGDISGTTSGDSVTEAAESYRQSVKNNKSGGAVLAIGGGNKADYVKHSQLMGVNNKVTGTDGDVSEFVMVDGYENTVTNSDNVTVIGSTNTVQGNSNKIYGDKHNVTGKDNVIIGSNDTLTDTTVDGATILGHNANATAAGGVALGEGSIASRALGTFGTAEKAAFNDDNLETATWKSTAAAVSVGGNGITRQITNVAAGSEDTDAVNVAQLRKVAEAAKDADTKAGKHSTVTVEGKAYDTTDTDTIKGDNLTLKKTTSDGVNNYDITLNDKVTLGTGDNQVVLDGTKGQAVIGSITINDNGKITNVADGEVSAASTDAVNGSQLNSAIAKATTKVKAGKNISSVNEVTDTTDGHTEYTIDAYDTQLKGDSNVSVGEGTLDGNNVRTYNIKLNDTVTIGSTDGTKVTIDGTNGTVTGLTNKTLEATDFATVGRAATEEQLALVKSDIETNSYKGWKVSANNGKTTANVDSNDTVDFANSDNNVTITQNGKNIDLKLANDVKINDSLEVGDELTVKDGNVAVNATTFIQGATTINDGDGAAIRVAGGKVYAAAGTDYVAMTGDGVKINGITVATKDAEGNSQIHNVAKGEADTDAVNVSQLKAYTSENDTHIKAGNYSIGDVTVGDETKQGVSIDIVNGKGETQGTVTIADVAKASDVGDVSEIASDIQNKEGKTTVVDAVNNLNDKVGDLNYSTVEKGDIADGDSSTTAIGKLSQKLSDVETTAKAHNTVSNTDGNITIAETENADKGTNYEVGLNKEKIDLGNVTIEGNNGKISATTMTTGDTSMTTDGIKVGDTASLTKNAVTIGTSSLTTDTLKVGGNTYIDGSGINANSQKITNVADGEVSETSADAVNGSQLYQTNQQVINNSSNISNIYGNMNKLDSRIKRVGAGAAALAALHPLDFDPDGKWEFAAGYGNYRGANAVAIGTFYRPNEDTMFSVGGSFGGGENMVNAGVTLRVGAGSNHVTTSRVAMAKEIVNLRDTVAQLVATVNELSGQQAVKSDLAIDFPDVPENHWAYEYVKKLADAGILTGYPDGYFKGDQTMTRYEFAAITYRALQNGAMVDRDMSKMLATFKPELELIRVDTITTHKDGTPDIERVRTIKSVK